jgi:hypothetical protein
MAVQILREAPSNLSHARLYLDDVEQVAAILVEALNSVPIPSYAPPERLATTVEYVLQDRKADTISDLHTLGGYSTEFSLVARRGYANVTVVIYHRLNPRVEARGLPETQQWETHGSIKQIFQRRSMVAKNILDELPSKLKSWISWLYVLIPFMFGFLLPHRALTYFLLMVVYVMGFVATGIVTFSKSRVYFAYSYDKSRVAAEVRRGYIEKIALLASGALLNEVIRRVAAHFLKSSHKKKEPTAIFPL